VLAKGNLMYICIRRCFSLSSYLSTSNSKSNILRLTTSSAACS
jgi:hypothetical protein